MEKKINEIKNTIKFLSLDAIDKANSGHPGICMGFADTVAVLFQNHLRFNPADPRWLGRDRLVLSAGHGAPMLYSLLHLYGYKVSLDDLKNLRQLDSKTPGHPEAGHTDGVELTTGPLGQGIANSVGMAIEGKSLAERYSAHLFHYRIYTIVGDGCLYEGVAQEAMSLAGHLKLDNLVVLYDDNSITLDGPVSSTLSEDRQKKFEAMGWEVLVCEKGNDVNAVHDALSNAEKSTQKKPKIVMIKTIIGIGSKKEGTNDVHGSPIGKEETLQIKQKEGYNTEPFYISEEVKKMISNRLEENKHEYDTWKMAYHNFLKSNPEFTLYDKGLHETVDFQMSRYESGQKAASRTAYNKAMDEILPKMKFLFGGSPDLGGSDKSKPKSAVDFRQDDYKGNFINYGIREHAMGAIINGISSGGLSRAYGGGFLIFSDYMRPTLRLASLSHYPSMFIFTHDSVALGEDGPTHQPVEHLASIRQIPQMVLLRPGDPNETVESIKFAVNYTKGPIVLALSRQDLPVLDIDSSYKNISKGAYVLRKDDNPQVLLIGTGSELELVMKAYEQLKDSVAMQVVSMPSIELFLAQDTAYQESVVPSSLVKRVIVEAGIKASFCEFLTPQTRFVGVSTFGLSAPQKDIYNRLGITVENIVKNVQEIK